MQPQAGAPQEQARKGSIGPDISIVVVNSKGKKVFLDVPQSGTVNDVAELMATKEKIPVSMVVLKFGGDVLVGKYALKACGVTGGAELKQELDMAAARKNMLSNKTAASPAPEAPPSHASATANNAAAAATTITVPVLNLMNRTQTLEMPRTATIEDVVNEMIKKSMPGGIALLLPQGHGTKKLALDSLVIDVSDFANGEKLHQTLS
jgi:hypothetical protein